MIDREISNMNVSQLLQFWSETNVKIYNTTLGFFINPDNKKKTVFDAMKELMIILGSPQTLIVIGANIVLLSLILIGIFVIKN